MTSIIKSRSSTKQPPSTSSSKSWVILQVSAYCDSSLLSSDQQILCAVDPYESVKTAASKLEGLIFHVFNCDPSHSFIRYVSIERMNGKEGSVSLKTTMEHLVEHLKEVEVWPSSDPGRPNLWGSGRNRLEIYFKPREVRA